jgi:hypothetical protein
MEHKFYESIIERLQALTKDNGLIFHHESAPRFEWMQILLVNPGVRRRFAIEGEHSAIVGMIVVPKPGRKHSNEAWNRFDPPLPSRLSKIEREGHDGKRLVVVTVQIWERERTSVLIPVKDLERTRKYRETGNFKVLKDCGRFRLQTANFESEVRLKDRLDQLLTFLPS